MTDPEPTPERVLSPWVPEPDLSLPQDVLSALGARSVELDAEIDRAAQEALAAAERQRLEEAAEREKARRVAEVAARVLQQTPPPARSDAVWYGISTATNPQRAEQHRHLEPAPRCRDCRGRHPASPCPYTRRAWPQAWSGALPEEMRQHREWREEMEYWNRRVDHQRDALPSLRRVDLPEPPADISGDWWRTEEIGSGPRLADLRLADVGRSVCRVLNSGAAFVLALLLVVLLVVFRVLCSKAGLSAVFIACVVVVLSNHP